MIVYRHPEYKDREIVSNVHRAFPYKYYLKILGNNTFNNYIAVVSNTELNSGKLSNIIIEENNKQKAYKTVSVSIMDIKDKKIDVFTVKQ